MSEDDGLIWAFDIDSRGQGREIEWDELYTELESETGYRWIHLELEGERALSWLREKSGLTELQVDALTADETRPRSTPMGEGLLLILRGVNLNPGAAPEDMVSVRLWADANRVITVRRRRLLAMKNVRDQVVQGRGPSSTGEFIADVANELVGRMAVVLADLDEHLDIVEADDPDTKPADKRSRLLDLRRQAIALRRHLSPQRDALARVSTERLDWLGERERLHLREVLDRTTRYVEDLEAARERAAVTQEELGNLLAEQLNQRMYALSIVAGVFLPLSFATGLLGINVAGIPGAEISWAFWGVCASCVILAIGEIALFRKLGWL